MARLMVRSYDRGHSISLRNAEVDYEIRETFELALAFGGAALRMLGRPSMFAEVTADIRRRDIERLEDQVRDGILAGSDKLIVAPRPEPLITPRGKTVA